jgi:CO/xanthine dehydrogenase FAD-binding subunit
LDGFLPGLDASAWVFGSVRICNRATIGGNLGNASPAGDTIPPLVVAGAVAIVNGPERARSLPVADVVTGPRRTVLRPGEWIETLEVPLPGGEEGFRKFGTRKTDAVTIVSLAWRWRRTPDGRLHDVSLALGAVAPTVVRAKNAEAELEDRRPGDDVIDRAMVALRSEISPIDDYRASGQYRREVAGVLLREELLTRATPDQGSRISA